MKRNLLFAVLALTAAGFWFPSSAQDLPSLEQFYSALPGQEAPPSPAIPFRAAAYLAGAVSVNGEKLFQYLHEATEYPVLGTGTDYLKAKKYMFSVADNTGCGGRPGVTCAYSLICVPGASEHGADYKEPGDANGDGIQDRDGMNAEHVWPQGFFDEAKPMKSDLHHIFPTFITVNNMRGSQPFGEVSSPVYGTNSGSQLGDDGFEPADAVKGDVARAMLYFVLRYHDRSIRDGVDYADFWKNRVPLFMKWHLQDPPDAAERRRNDLIDSYQGNRNPFVDDPRLVEKIGLKVFQAH
ncbi:MAG: endonuclease [Elusimicrobiales bacterium]|nr:endonuclease [Elusimicrobiales bacterium]